MLNVWQNSKKAVWVILLAIFFVGIGVFAGWRFWRIDTTPVFQVITADMKHERMISWKAKSDGAPGFLELRASGEEAVLSIQAAQYALPVYQNKEDTVYTIQLANLKENTQYAYRVSVGGQYSRWHEFTTEVQHPAAFKALIFGDSQSSDYGIWAKTAQTAWNNNRDAAFFVNMGDLVDNGQDVSQWNGWLNGAKELLAAVPVVPVMGNHESYSLDWKPVEPNYYLALFAVPQNGPQGLERYAYSFDYGDVHFVVLNTQVNELGEWHPDMLEQQKQWLAADLANTQKQWKVVLMHRGVWESRFNTQLNELGQSFVPVFDRFQVDVVFTAHVHSYSRTKQLKNSLTNPFGTVYISTGRSGSRVWEKSPQKQLDEVFYNPVDKPNYLVLEAADSSLAISAFRQDGSLIDQVKLEK